MNSKRGHVKAQKHDDFPDFTPCSCGKEAEDSILFQILKNVKYKKYTQMIQCCLL